MKFFRFQQFRIQQQKEVFKIGTDAMLLGCLAKATQAKNILEIGTGTGVLALMLAQRNAEAQILALDIDPNAILLAQENFEKSPFYERLQAIEVDFRSFSSSTKYDFIISNPPYFEENPSTKDVLARQRNTLDFNDLLTQSKKLLTVEGILSVILPVESETEFIRMAEEISLHLIRKIRIFGIEGAKQKRSILEFSIQKQSLQTSDFTIEKSPRIYSDSYLELTKDFHVFGK